MIDESHWETDGLTNSQGTPPYSRTLNNGYVGTSYGDIELISRINVLLHLGHQSLSITNFGGQVLLFLS